MNVLLVHPQINVIQSYSRGLGYIASVLKEGGHTVDYIMIEDLNYTAKLSQVIKNHKPEIIGFSLYSCQMNYIGPIIEDIKKYSDAFIVLGGIHPTVKPECILQISGADAIVRGEGEIALLELADTLQKKEDIRHIKNFWFKSGKEIIKNEMRPLIDLNGLPFPDKDIVDYQLLLDQSGGVNRFTFNRGCPFDCPYCSNKVLRDVYKKEISYCRSLNPKRAIEEIASDAAKFKFEKIFFDDDIITLDKKWFYEFFTLYKKYFKYPFYCNVRVGTIDANMVRLLKEAGAKGVAIGIEHGNEEFRKNILRRNITDKQIIDTLKLFEEHGIKDNYGQVMIGLPFENKELFLDTVRLCRLVNISYFKYIFYPYPATEFGELCEKNNWLPTQEYYMERKQAVIDYPDFKKADIQLCYDLFTGLVKFKFFPLKLPWIPTGLLLKFYNFLLKMVIPVESLLRRSLGRIKKYFICLIFKNGKITG